METFGFHLARLDFRDHSSKLDGRESELLAELWTMGAIQKQHGRTAADHFILSMTRGAGDMLHVHRLARLAASAVPLAVIGLMGGVASLGFAAAALSLTSVVALIALEFIVAFLQAFVFAALTCVYLNDVVNLHSH